MKKIHILSHLNHSNIIKVFYYAIKVYSNYHGEIVIDMKKRQYELI